MTRKIVQIAATHVPDNERTNPYNIVHALCDDGTVWETTTSQGWYPLPPIPQDDAEVPA